MSDNLREIQVRRPGVMTTDPPTPGTRIVRCTAIGDTGVEINLPISGIEYTHGSQGDGTVKLLVYAHHVVFPVDGRDA